MRRWSLESLALHGVLNRPRFRPRREHWGHAMRSVLSAHIVTVRRDHDKMLIKVITVGVVLLVAARGQPECPAQVEVYWVGEELFPYHENARAHAALLWTEERRCGPCYSLDSVSDVCALP